MITPVVKEPDPILHAAAKPVAAVTPEILALAGRMIETMHAARGVGLAANQIGSGLAILVASHDGARGKELVLINPSLVKRGGKVVAAEGCLSLPGVSSEVSRSARVTAKGLDRSGAVITVEADGLLARILQHEVDHLSGKLFVDRLGAWKRHKLLKDYASISQTLRQVKL